MTYNEAIAYIHSISWRGSRPGLKRIGVLCDLLGNPQDALSFVHVAGTNGKGSVCAMLAEICQQSGYRTGMFTSPYVHQFNERIAIDGAPISNSRLAQIIAKIRPVAEQMEDPPTEFELITAAAFLYFYEERCQIVILEAGLGGRLDSTNIIKTPSAAVITGIGLDHTAQLGSTISAIAREKAGIIKAGCPVILGSSDPDVQRVVGEKAALEHAPVHLVDLDKLQIEEVTLNGTRFSLAGEQKPYHLQLLGKYQPRNAAIAIETAKVLGLSEVCIHAGIENSRWPARFEILQQDPLVIFDGGHNPQGIDAVVESVETLFPDKVHILTGVLADKEYVSMALQLQKIAASVFCVTPDNPRALSAEDYAVVFAKAGMLARPAQSIDDGLETAMQKATSDGKPVLIVGSLYMYKDVRQALEYLEQKKKMS